MPVHVADKKFVTHGTEEAGIHFIHIIIATNVKTECGHVSTNPGTALCIFLLPGLVFGDCNHCHQVHCKDICLANSSQRMPIPLL
jgi:hypothetical protein